MSYNYESNGGKQTCKQKCRNISSPEKTKVSKKLRKRMMTKMVKISSNIWLISININKLIYEKERSLDWII